MSLSRSGEGQNHSFRETGKSVRATYQQRLVVHTTDN